MIRVINTLFVRRPERRLYYLPEITSEVIKNIEAGIYPQEFTEYQGAFGTYDEVGLFCFNQDMKAKYGMSKTVGIEFRDDDDRVDYPELIPYIILPACNLIVLDVAYIETVNIDNIDSIINSAKHTENARYFEYEYVEDGIVSVFLAEDKLRIMYEIKLVNEATEIMCLENKNYGSDIIYHMAYRDTITGYNNWNCMWEFLSSFYLVGIKDYAFVHFDVKDFKMINELYGHQVGNLVLQRIANIIEKHKDWVYFGVRCDNDNFALMIKDMYAEETKEKLSDLFEEASVLDEDPNYKIFFRCGVVKMRTAMNMGNIVADCAKVAQSSGIKINATEIKFYTSKMYKDLIWGKQLKAYLPTAIKEKEFQVYLQPKMNAGTETICGAEALVRWDYKHKGLMSPARFIPFFEMDDSIIKVDEVVLHLVCAKIKEWKEKGYKIYPISVNLSRKHLEQYNMVKHLTDIVDMYGIEHSLIEFELTETVAYDNQRFMIYIMNELKAQGFMISMDDFGTGYSSFSLLKDMPLDTLKIDKSFVDLLVENEESDKINIIIGHIISMSQKLGIHSIAEGAEEYSQIQALKKLGCEMIQGYYYSKPITMDDYEKGYLT